MRTRIVSTTVVVIGASLVGVTLSGNQPAAAVTATAPQTVSFTTPGITSYQAPSNASHLRVTVVGGRGGGEELSGGDGGYIQGDVPVNGVGEFTVEVGQDGDQPQVACALCAFLGGNGVGAIGGSGSAVQRGFSASSPNFVAVAGGGGGGTINPLFPEAQGGDAAGLLSVSGIRQDPGPSFVPGEFGVLCPYCGHGGLAGVGADNGLGGAGGTPDGTAGSRGPTYGRGGLGGPPKPGNPNPGGGGGGGDPSGGGGGGGSTNGDSVSGGGGAGGGSYLEPDATHTTMVINNTTYPQVDITAFDDYSSVALTCAPTIAGVPTTCQAHVSSTNPAEIATGTVSFAGDTTQTDEVYIVGPSSCSLDASATCSVVVYGSPYALTGETLTAVYSGDALHLGSSTSTLLSQQARASSTTVTCKPNPVTVNQITTCTAKAIDVSPVTVANIAPTGSFTFSNGKSCTNNLGSSCSIVVVPTAVGPITLGATFTPTPNPTLYTGSSGSTNLDVVAAPPGQASFLPTASEQTYVVPAGVQWLHVHAVGGHGGFGRIDVANTRPGGAGALVESDIPVTGGETLYVNVGGVGGDKSAAAGYNGGGSASQVVPGTGPGSGGGASDVRSCSVPIAQADACRLVVAAGGGGGGAIPIPGFASSAGGAADHDSTGNPAAQSGEDGGTGTTVGGAGTMYQGGGGGGYVGGQAGHCAGAGCGGAGGSSFVEAGAQAPSIGLAAAAATPNIVLTPDAAPSAPTGVSAVANADGTVGVAWDAPFDSGAGAVSGYTLTASPPCAGCTGTTTDGATTTTTISGLAVGTSYTFVVNATSNFGAGDTSAPSNPVVPDATPPVVTPVVTGTQQNGWYTSDVGVSWSVGDPETGIASSDGCGSVTVTTDTLGTTFTCSAANGNGVSTTRSVTIERDSAAPVITVTQPVDGASFALGSTVVAAYTCADAASGVESCTGSVADGAAIDTSAPGSHVVTIDATDTAGNTALVTVHYVVVSAPTVTSFAPNLLGDGASRVPVTITGTGFLAGAKIKVPGGGITFAAVTIVNATTITAKATVATTVAAGKHDVVVTTAAGKGTCTRCLVIVASPTLTKMSPAAARGTTVAVTLKGTRFSVGATLVGPAGVKFTKITVKSSTTITATIKVAATAPIGTNLPVTVIDGALNGYGRATANLLTIT